MSENEKSVSVPEAYALRACEIADLEERLKSLRKEQEDAKEPLLRLIEERGENIRTRFGTLYLHRTVVIQPVRSPEYAAQVVRDAGLPQFVERRIVNEKELARYIDQHDLADQLSHGIKVHELYSLRVRKAQLSHE